MVGLVLSSFAAKKLWAPGDSNPQPADFSGYTVLLDSRALFLTMEDVLARFSACFVQKLSQFDRDGGLLKNRV